MNWKSTYIGDTTPLRNVAALSFAAVSNAVNIPSLATRFALRSCTIDEVVAGLFMERFGVDGKLDYNIMVEACYPGVF